ncbi:MAG: nucleotidyl transferase AbiEii/AbiGii toxin family protein [Deltaproteobacteria bacterium]|nr:nucleotidyl transferase AbiEii/AbiGii toxin family protein [Deltaproteobacteria bacterium]
MPRETKRNIEESVRQRLNNLAKTSGREHQDLILSYLMERFLYRLSQTRHKSTFVLKGALMLRLLGGPSLSRATRDIDLLSEKSIALKQAQLAIEEIVDMPVPPDGVRFDLNTLKVTEIQGGSRDRGVRASIIGHIGSARATLQIDIGSGYRVVPQADAVEFPQLLNFGSPSLFGYTAESIIADKFEAMVSRDETNTRLKDFYDISVLLEIRRFEGEILEAAINETFGYYGTLVPNSTPICFQKEFYDRSDKKTQWKTFLRNSKIESPYSFQEVVLKVRDFLMPLCSAINKGIAVIKVWEPSSGWK